jgi:glycosyltransferase involved in cell wall biosynthesis
MIRWTENPSASGSEGYGYAARSIINGLKKHKIEVNDFSNTPPDDYRDLIRLGISYTNKTPCNELIRINHCLPEIYSVGSKYSIGFSYWETNRLPGYWIPEMNVMDEIWTVSKWAKDVFIESGVKKPVYDFKLGVDKNLYFPPKEPRRSHNDRFRFLSIGSPSSRKNSQMAVDAFLKVFGRSDECVLIYKSMGAPDARLYKGTDHQRKLHGARNINVIDYELSHEELAKLYDSADCVLYPTSGEGWGILPMKAIAKGIPTICTNATACTEYAELSMPLNYRWGTDNMHGIYSGCGTWAIPDFDDLCDKMLYVFNHYEEISSKTLKGARWINKNLSWTSATKPMADRLCQILNHM